MTAMIVKFTIALVSDDGADCSRPSGGYDFDSGIFFFFCGGIVHDSNGGYGDDEYDDYVSDGYCDEMTKTTRHCRGQQQCVKVVVGSVTVLDKP